MSNQFYEFFDLRKDQEVPHIIDQTIRSGVKVVGTNLWVLIFAILIASVGLNVNSTAVIIGAMLISPLMGPIVGIGYGTGINDFNLIKLALRNLAIFTFISLLSSTLYFTVSPLNTITPELLARTAPNLWDVLIAFFGGSAGIIAITRKSISNVVPGVAIATALMPPLCTAGYGISQGNWEFFGGAFFLYCINSVFIAFASLVFVKIFKLPQHMSVDEQTSKRTNLLIGLTIFLMIVPSAYLAYNFVKQNEFTTQVDEVIRTASKDPNFVILGQEVDGIKKEIFITVGGENPPANLAGTLESRLNAKGIDNAQVIVRRSGSGQVDMSSLKSELQQDLYKNLQEQVNTLSSENSKLNETLKTQALDQKANHLLFDELRTQYPSIVDITVSQGQQFAVQKRQQTQVITAKNTSDTDKETNDETNTNAKTETNTDAKTAVQTEASTQVKPLLVVAINSTTGFTSEEEKRLTDWINVRFQDKANQSLLVQFFIEGLDDEATEATSDDVNQSKPDAKA